ncbi:MAG: virulence-associated E family protein [Xanthobacteraceae bacterium]|nr:virulence-associated E family protein [Xanthobacteraceae bacterium]
MATSGDADPNDVPPWERHKNVAAIDSLDAARKLSERAGNKANVKSIELASRRVELRKADIELSVEELLAHLGTGGASIHDHRGAYVDQFRRLHKLNPLAARPVWAALERLGHPPAEITALLNGAATVEPAPTVAENPEFPDTDKHGNPKATFANARVAIGALGIVCRYDAFHDRLFVGGRMIDQWAGELSDYVVVMLRELIVRTYGFDPGREHTRDAAVQLCQKNKFDPVVEYLDRVKWDGHPRVDAWLISYLGAEDTALNRAIGRLGLIAAVRRARQPGCKFDQIIVLEGPEGRGKSSAIEILAGSDNFSDQLILTLDERAQQEAVTGVWLYEIAEIAGISKADVDRVKAFASRTVDRARPAYGRFRVNRPRRCIFIATTNNDTYLKSQTGNRRFWPVKIGRVDIAKVIADRDQLWAEAAVLEAAGSTLTLPEDLWAQAAREQEQRLDHDPWIDMLEGINGHLCRNEQTNQQELRISAAVLLLEHLGIARAQQGDAAFKRLSACMRRNGWLGPTKLRIAGDVVRGYRRPLGPAPRSGLGDENPERTTLHPERGGQSSDFQGILAPGESPDDFADAI